eukprot:CAMPEP_0185912612 /NCGR_PEP_ID=MMETSP0196C-20130402/40563_1 /TAXON_ID=2932 /ORGANISM="Alexandrium fundyense, Strain CCMP1719" /LENGTH=38 /DNA_ID= /DNA_START= /DNA_END= /DNA_ORIENTATION=
MTFSLCYVHTDSLQLILDKDDFEVLWALAAVLNSAFSF